MRPSASAVTVEADVAAYLLTRMPATYAAVATGLAEAQVRLPGFGPRTLLDAGAGPGTGSWGAVETFPDLDAVTMLDHNAGLLAAARRLAGASDHAALHHSQQLIGNLHPFPLDRRFDLVLASYALTELPDGKVVSTALDLWEHCDGVLVLIEPGRTRDFGRLMAVRAALLEAGAKMVAPCPHENACPLPEGDWCHFSVRLPRSRAHMQAKSGTIGYEDEKFSYCIFARPGIAVARTAARVLRPPAVNKFEVALPLCTPAGLATETIAKRSGEAFRAARKLEWGDAID
jgi:ribosomal protein RSM22 (predicted rRNA methylase)